MRKPNFTPVYKLLADAFITATIQVVVSRFFDYPNWRVLLSVTIGLLIVLFFVIDRLWIPVNQRIEKLRRNFHIASTTPEIDYSFKQNADKVFLRIHSSRKNQKLLLRLDFFTPEPRWLINEQTRYEIQIKFVNVNNKLMYWNQDLQPDTIIELPDPVAQITSDYLILFACGDGGRWEIPAPFGRYLYQFREQGTHKGNNFGKMRKFRIEVKEGIFTYEETN